jgi:hypothetical protein
LRKIFGDFGGGWLSGSLGLFFSSEFGKNWHGSSLNICRWGLKYVHRFKYYLPNLPTHNLFFFYSISYNSIVYLLGILHFTSSNLKFLFYQVAFPCCFCFPTKNYDEYFTIISLIFCINFFHSSSLP